MSTINITKRETIAGTKYPLQKITFQKPDLEGQMHEQVNEVYFRPDAVAILLADPKAKNFLLARQFLLPAFLHGSEKGYLTETCAGLTALQSFFKPFHQSKKRYGLISLSRPWPA